MKQALRQLLSDFLSAILSLSSTRSRVTCLPPPGSEIVPSREAFTPGPASGLPLVRSAGQFGRHPLTFAHVSLLRVSLVNRYSVNPELVTRIVPWLVWRKPTFVSRSSIKPNPARKLPGPAREFCRRRRKMPRR